MKTTDLTVSRTIRGTAEAVYDAWLDPEGPGSLWYGSKRVIMHLEVDALFYLLVEHEWGGYWPRHGPPIA